MGARRCANGVWIALHLVVLCQASPFKVLEPESKLANVKIKLNVSSRDTNKSRVAHQIVCDVGEYFFNGHCCKYCPAGTKVHRGCRTPHAMGECQVCTNGKNYTEYASGMEKCLPCTVCRWDQEMIFPCTVAKDTVCQCKPGTFCLPDLPCEVCQSCSKRCSDDMVILKECNATKDSVCGPPPPTIPESSSPGIISIISACLLFIVGLAITLISCYCQKKNCCSAEKQKSEEDGDVPTVVGVPLLQSEDDQATGSDTRRNVIDLNLSIVKVPVEHPCGPHEIDPLPHGAAAYGPLSVCEENPQTRPSALSLNEETLNPMSSSAMENKELEFVLRYNKEFLKEVKEKPQNALTSSFYIFISEVPFKEWKAFMRSLKLKENEIDVAVYNNNKDVTEQRYQMLRTWQEKCGKDAVINVLLRSLLDIGLKGCAENIVNTLINKGIYKYNDG